MASTFTLEELTGAQPLPMPAPQPVTESHHGVRTRHAAFWSTLVAAPVAIGVGVATLLDSRRAGALAGGITAALLGATRWQLRRVFTTEPAYTVERRIHGLEIRNYAPRVEARTTIEGADFDRALDEGFDRLASYVFGGNYADESLGMTAPVFARGELLTMTAPMFFSPGGHTLAFVMPPGRSLESLPRPRDVRVFLTNVQARRVAVLPFRGRYRAAKVERKAADLVRRCEQAGLAIAGQPSFAGYDAPSTLPLLRRNEIWVDLAD